MTDHSLPRRITKPATTYQCPFMTVTHQRAEFEGFAKDYFVVNFSRRAGVVVVREGNVLLVQQYRLLINAESWELPGGTIEADEGLQEGLIRECIEETGVRPSDMKRLLDYYPGLDNVDNPTALFYSERSEVIGDFKKRHGEVTAVVWIPLEESLHMVFDGRILDVMTIAGLLAYEHTLRKGTVNFRLAR